LSSGEEKILYSAGASSRGWHRLQLAAECLQKYAWTYKVPTAEGAAPRHSSKSPALVKGTLIHLALAQHYARMRSEQAGTPQDEWCEPEESVRLIAKLEDATQFAEDVIYTYQQYCREYPYEEEVQTMKILGVEELFSTTIRGRYLYTGRMDLLYEDLGGRVYLADHKSTGRLTASHKEYFAISGQLMGYAHLARQVYGDRLSGVKVNLVQHGAPKFERITLSRSPFLESKFEQIVVDIEEAIERMEATGRDFDDWPKASNELSCFGRYGACQFIDQCRFGVGAKKAGNWTWKDL